MTPRLKKPRCYKIYCSRPRYKDNTFCSKHSAELTKAKRELDKILIPALQKAISGVLDGE